MVNTIGEAYIVLLEDISGYDDGLLTQGCRANEEVAFPQKPFEPDALLQKVRDILKPLD
jgi:hypothetical protein